MLDIVIRRGRRDRRLGAHLGRRADVGVGADRIVVVGEVQERGRQEIDADGRIVIAWLC